MSKKIIKILDKVYKSPITCLTAYSPSIAKILDGSVDIILIGDSLGTTLYGMENSQGVTLEMMKAHGLAVTKNVKKSITMIDMPYKTYANNKQALKNASELIEYTNAKLLKLEINTAKLSVIKYLSGRKINVISHIGVTPQSFNDFKKIKAVGKTIKDQRKLIKLAIESEKAGAKGILLECVAKETAKKITSSVSIPTIGIGSSNYCDGQVLVFDDLIKINSIQHKPKFVKHYMNFVSLAKRAINKYNKDVKVRRYPGKKHTY